MVSVPSTHLVLFIASIAVAASVAGAFTAESSRLSATVDEVSNDMSAEVQADIEIITDASGSVYDGDSDEITVHVQNIGESTLPHQVDQVDVFLNGEFQTAAALGVNVQGASSWAPDEVVEITISAPDLAWGDHRLKVVVDGDAEVIEFRNCAGVTRDSIAFEKNENKNLAVINRSGVVTDLGVKTDGFSPVMADFDCDGLHEVAYIDDGTDTVHIIDRNGKDEQLTTDTATQNRRLGVGDLDGDGNPAVVFANSDDNNYLYRVEQGEPAERVGEGYAARSIGGVADFNDDGDLDIVYLSTNDMVYYLDNGTATNTEAKANDALGIGSPMDFDGDGEVRVPIRGQTDNAIRLVDSNGNQEIILTVYTGAVGSLASFDWNDDGTPDILSSHQGDGRKIYYLQLDGTNTAIVDEDGNTVPTSTLGVA